MMFAMKMKLNLAILAIFPCLILCASLAIGEDQPASIPPGFVDVDSMRHALGLSLGSARVYTIDHGFSFTGYGEMVYQKYSRETHFTFDPSMGFPTGKDAEFTILRGVVFVGYRLSDRLILNSEIRVDRNLFDRGVSTFAKDYNPPTVDDVEGSLDQAYLDYVMSPALTLRAGVILLPVGLYNEYHRPDENLGTRPALGQFYTYPSIWHALGFGIAGTKYGFDYRVYVVNGLNAAGFSEFGVRGGRETSWDTISHPSMVFRADYHPFPGGTIGVTYYTGNSGIFLPDRTVDLKIHTTFKDLHGQVLWKGAFVQAQYSKGLLHSTPELNQVLEKRGRHGIGKRIVSGFVEGGWNLLWTRRDGSMLRPYLRGEASNPQDALPPPSLDLGLRKNHQLDFIDWNIGVEYRPIPRLILKPEYERIHDEDDNAWHEFHLGVAYIF